MAATKKPAPKLTPAPKPLPKPVAKKPVQIVKPKSTPSLPSLEDYKKSAAYRSGEMTYKEYLDIAKAQQSAKAKAKK